MASQYNCLQRTQSPRGNAQPYGFFAVKFPNESEEFVFRIAEMKNQQICKDDNGKPSPLSEEEMLSLLKQAKVFAAKKIRKRQIQKEDSTKQTEKKEGEDTRLRQSIQKFSLNGMLAEVCSDRRPTVYF